MEYVKGEPYFCKSQEKIKQYPYLDTDIKTDILIIGGGIIGSIANYYLSQKHNIVIVDKSRFGQSCTSCATALLEYQLDDYASDLVGSEMTEQEVVECYKMGLNSIKKIDNFVKRNGNHCEFALRPTLMYSDKIIQSAKVQEEYEFRKKYGFDCELLDESNNPFPFKIKKGLFCKEGGCEFNPYLFTKQMIENSKNQKQIFENTEINKIERIGSEYSVLTNFGNTIICKKVIISTGFNWEFINETDLCERFISYSIVTNPIENFEWYEKTLIHDSKEPYHYLRALPNKRIIYGGEDTTFKGKPIDLNLANKVYDKLLKNLKELFPNIENEIQIDYKFCGAFGTTDNNLGLIGKTEDENILYFFSCGANGIINAMFGVELIEDILKNKQNPLENLFSPLRNLK